MVLNRVLVAVVLFAMAALLLVRTALAQMAFYIHPRYEVLLYFCAAFVFVFALAIIPARDQLPRATLPIVLVPLLLGVLIVPAPLRSTTLLQQGPALNRVAQRVNSAHIDIDVATVDTTVWSLYDWAVASSIDIAPLRGRPAQVSGFVVFPEDLDLPPDQLMLARYVLTCCVADAGGVGVRVQWPAAQSLVSDQWVEVTGIMQSLPVGDTVQPLLIATRIQPIDPPKKPYLTTDAPPASSTTP
jgi:uncharacterized repeat protein (TIGR03943 family)